MTPEEERQCMLTNPFEGDFGDGEVILKDHMGNARKAGPCVMCGQDIKPKDRVRLRTEAYDGKIMTFRWCPLCCAALAASRHDAGEAWEARINLHPNQQIRYASLNG